MSYKLKLGSHVSCNKTNKYLLGSISETISYNANALMVFTGPPQNSIRTDINNFFIEEFKEKMSEHQISFDDLIVHAPYIINMANSLKKSTFNLGVETLKSEIIRADKIGASVIVLHPGSSVGAPIQDALDSFVNGINKVLTQEQNVKVAIETMSGKGSEIGVTFEQIKYILDRVKLKDKIGVCWDTCHMWDAGYDLVNHLEEVIEEFKLKIGLDKLLCFHINDSKNPFKASRDRHANIGYGYLGFEAINKIVHHPLFDNIPKILETPFIDKTSPYKEEIRMFKEQSFNDPFKEELEIIKK